MTQPTVTLRTNLAAYNMGLLQAGLTQELPPLSLSITFGAWRQVAAFKPRLTTSPETLPAMLDDHTITTVYKVIGGLSADNFGLDFGVIQTGGASLQFLSGGQFNADFGKNLSRTDNHLTRLTTF